MFIMWILIHIQVKGWATINNGEKLRTFMYLDAVSTYGQGFDQACHPFFQCHSDATTNNKGSRVKFSHNQ